MYISTSPAILTYTEANFLIWRFLLLPELVIYFIKKSFLQFQQFLDVDVTLPADKISSLTDGFFPKLNALLLKLKSILLVQNVVETLKVCYRYFCINFVWKLKVLTNP